MLEALTYKSPISDVKQSTGALVNGPGQPAFRRWSKSRRAAFAVAVLRGEVELRPTLHVVAKALDVSVTYVKAERNLSPEQLNQVRKGWVTLTDLKPNLSRKDRPIDFDAVIAWWKAASDSERAAVVARVGVTSTWDALASNLV
jgi:hypothetical protein